MGSELIVLGVKINLEASVGDVVSALSLMGSAAAFTYAVLAGRSALRDWRTQRQLDKRAEIASQALVEIYRMTDFLRAMLHSREEDHAKQSEREAAFDARWRPVLQLENDFLLTIVHVDAHLGIPEHAAMEVVWNAKVELWEGQANRLHQEDDAPDHDTVYGFEAGNPIFEARFAADELFKPIARHEEPAKKPWWCVI